MSVHVLPVGDLIEHQADDDCPCGVTTQPVERDDGSIGWLHVHHSLDGREQAEPPTHWAMRGTGHTYTPRSHHPPG